MSSSSNFPFDHVVVTFPDDRAAQAAQMGPLAMLQEQYGDCQFHATTDPLNCRVGSGGGTLAAFDEITEEDATVLILHAGGQSSRCPTQMVLGKAWTSLPTVNGITTPLERWLQQCCTLCANLPPCSVVVVASDTLLQLPKDIMVDWTSCPGHSVVGLAVPAPLETASHHGVYLVNNDTEDANNDPTFAKLLPCHEIWQKPSVEQLLNRGSFEGNDRERLAWIDTGVIVFLPEAARALRRLAQTTLSCCTRSGLERAWQESKMSQLLLEFARTHAQSVDLYTHVLQALRLDDALSREERRQAYVQQHVSTLGHDMALQVWEMLESFSLQILVCQGRFWHLGTTRELTNVLVQGSSEVPGSETKQDLDHLSPTSLGRELKLTQRLSCFYKGIPITSDTTVLYHCCLEASSSSSIGPNSVLEHCDYTTTGSIDIGNDCLVSGLRCTWNDSQFDTDDFCLPKGLFVQLVPLMNNDDNCASYVYMVLGMDDNVKSCDTLYGQPLERLLESLDVSPDMVWANDDNKRMLWTARLHPVVTADKKESFASLFGWLSQINDGCNKARDSTSLQAWKSHKRLSLAEIRDQADGAAEFEYRQKLLERISKRQVQHVDQMAETIQNRQHVATDLQFAIDLYQAGTGTQMVVQALNRLDNIIREAIHERQYDVAGRACMVASAFLDSLAQTSATNASANVVPPASVKACCSGSNLLRSTSSLNDTVDPTAFEELIRVRNDCITNSLAWHSQAWLLSAFSVAMEKLAQSMTERCVCSTEELQRLRQHCQRTTPIYNQWIVATAPARIDLAGGWSDTPPICFEYGSSVTGIAVCVDDKKPLLCRCRIVSGRGLGLRSELRDIGDGSLMNSMEVEVISLHELTSYRDPQSDCALLKCAIVVLATVHLGLYLPTQDDDLQAFLNAICGCNDANGESKRLEIVVTSLLPHGSGLGTSSILGGCVLAAVGKCVGIDLTNNDPLLDNLIDSVLVLEQHLTTGGGFQDQVNGLVGGCKMVSSKPISSSAPVLELSVERLKVDAAVCQALGDRLTLAFTGKTRLAKNILQNVLRRWSQRTPEIVQTVEELWAGAQASRTALLQGDLDAVGDLLNAYWQQKKVMAGSSNGVEPCIVTAVLDILGRHDKIRGASLCGAGGGGFLVVLRRPGVSIEELISTLHDEDVDVSDVSWHSCCICNEGLSITTLEQDADMSTFDLARHSVSQPCHE